MRKIVLVVLFSLIVSGVYGQQRAENRWIVGRWTGVYEGQNIEINLNENGTGRINTNDITFSIVGNILQLFTADGNQTFSLVVGGDRFRSDLTIYRINDNRMVLSCNNRGTFNFIKRN